MFEGYHQSLSCGFASSCISIVLMGKGEGVSVFLQEHLVKLLLSLQLSGIGTVSGVGSTLSSSLFALLHPSLLLSHLWLLITKKKQLFLFPGAPCLVFLLLLLPVSLFFSLPGDFLIDADPAHDKTVVAVELTTDILL